MKKIKFISFDMWGTLIMSNPQFKKERANYVSDMTNKLSFDEVNDIFNLVKKDADLSVEKFGIQFSIDSLYKKIAFKLGLNDYKLLKYNCESLFLLNLPNLISDTKEILEKLKNEGYELVLSSNTLLICGETIKAALQQLEIDKYFSEMYFSDELKVSKPNPMFYKHVQENSNYLKSEIMHVGDNLTTDIIGAKKYGFHTYQINTLYNETLTSFYNTITQINNGNN